MAEINFLRKSRENKILINRPKKNTLKLFHKGETKSSFSQLWLKRGELIVIFLLMGLSFFSLLPFFGQEDRTNVFSAPLIPLLATFIEGIIPFGFGIRLWLLIFLIFFPLSFYYFVREISGRRLAAFLAGLLVLLPTKAFLRARIELGLLGEDGAHIASLTIIPLVCLLVLRFLRQGSFKMAVFSSLGTTLVILTSPLGFFILVTFMGVITFSELLLGRGRLKLLRFFLVLILALGFSAFWYNPKFAILIFHSPQGLLIRKTISNLLPVSFFILPILGVFGYLLFENRPQFQSMFIAFFLSVAFCLFSLGAGIANPTPLRFLPALGISLALLFGISVTWMFDFICFSSKFEKFEILLPYRKVIAWGLVGLIFVLIISIIGLKEKDFLFMQESQVLGLTTDKSVGIWEIKKQTMGPENIIGYIITFLTILGMGVIKIKLHI